MLECESSSRHPPCAFGDERVPAADKRPLCTQYAFLALVLIVSLVDIVCESVHVVRELYCPLFWVIAASKKRRSFFKDRAPIRKNYIVTIGICVFLTIHLRICIRRVHGRFTFESANVSKLGR